MRFRLCLLVALGFACVAPLRAINYFVALNGNDNVNDGRSAATPFRTVSRAASLVAAGDVVTVAAGTYNETVTIVRSGSAGAPISFRSPTRAAARIVGAVSIRASYIEFSGFDVSNPNLHGISLIGHHLTVRDNDVHDSQGDGIGAYASDYLTIEGNRLFRNGLENQFQASGISLFQPVAFDQAPGFHIVIRGNQAFDNESRVGTRGNTFTVGNGILLSDFRNTQDGSTAGPYRPATLIENNLLFNNVGRAIVIAGSDNIVVRNNTAWGNLRVRNNTATAATNGTFSSQDTDGVRWYNNIVSARGGSDLAVFELRTTGGVWDSNIIWNGLVTLSSGVAAAGLSPRNLFADPRLVNPAAANPNPANFRLDAASLAIDGGLATQSPATDFDGVARPRGTAVDIGAFESAPATAVPSGPPAFASQPASQTLLAGSFTTLVAQTTGAVPQSFQWAKSGQPIAGATRSTLTFAPVAATDDATYTVTVSNSAGSVTSNAAVVGIASTPEFVWRNPLPFGGTLNGVAYGGGKFVAVGVNGRVLVSTDVTTWTPVATLPTTALNAVAFDAFQWVAVGNGGALFTSRDGVNWTQRNASTTNTLRAIATVNNAWIATGDNGTIITSLDGVNWSVRTSGVTQGLYAVAGTTGRYVAAGLTGALLTSPDAITWTRVTPAGVTGDFYAAGYFNNLFVVAGATGAIYSSVDGVAWSVRTSPANGNWLRAVGYGGGRYVFMSDGDRVVVSTDLAVYANVTMPAYSPTVPRWSIAYGAGQFVAVGNGGEISSSPDGSNWTARGSSGARWANNHAAFLNNQWIVSASVGGILTSPDGVRWTRSVSPIGNWLRGAAYGAGRYVIAGDQGWIISSTDLVTWTGTQAASTTTQSFTSIAFANDRFVAVGAAGTIVTSTDGLTWTAATSGVLTALQYVGVFRNRFYAVGNNGVILASVDGLAWAPLASGTTQNLLSLGSDGGTLLVVGSARTILASTDGQNFVTRAAPNSNAFSFRGVTRCNGGWLIVGDAGVAMFSLDGIAWSLLETLGEAESLAAVASNGTSTVIAGNGGTILQANDPVLIPAVGAPTFPRLLASQSVVAGTYVSLVADPSGSAPFTYQWLKNNAPIAGATSSRLTFSPAQNADNGLYSVIVTNAAGSVTSNAATLGVTPLPEFAWRNPTPEGGSLHAVAYAGNRFLAVGTGSRVLTSVDGVNWGLAATLPNAVLFGIAGNGTQWAAVGNNGFLFTSFDAINWSQRAPGTTNNFRGVAAVGNGFIACCDGGIITLSPDGVNWTARPTGATQILWAIAYANGLFVAVGQTGTLLTSPDAVTWTRVPVTTATGAAISSDLNAVAFVNGQFIAAGNAGVILASADGATWTARTSAANTSNIRGIAHTGTQYVFVTDSDRVVTTPNLTTYTNITLPAYNLTVPRAGVAYGAGLLVTVGAGGEISSSPDGATWTQRGTAGARNSNTHVAFLNNRWMAVGSNGGVLTSPDGTTWTRQTAPAGNWLSGCAYGAGRYVVVGVGGYTSSSLDGAVWSGSATASGTTQFLLGVTFGNDRFVAVANGGAIITSTNGTAWTAANSGVTTSLNTVGFFAGRFYALGNGGVILSSSDGLAWTPVASGTTQNLLGLGTDGATLFVVGGGRTILASTDGVSWQPRTPPSTAPVINNGTYRGIARTNGGWIIVGDQGIGLFSIDGQTWDFLPSLANAEGLNAIASNAFTTVATGVGGAILQANNSPFGQSRLTNVATRGLVQPGGSLTPGFVLRGAGSKTVIVRAVGPTLSSFGLNSLSDLRFDLVNQQTSAIAASNEDWGGGAALSGMFATLGAFPLPPASKDAAAQSSLPVNNGGYSIRIVPSGGASTGVALAEVYDADPDSSPVRLVNVSTLGFVGTGDNVLTPGFVIRGSGAKLVLIRAVGPGLAPLGVTDLLADPQLSVFAASSNSVIATNNDWGSTAALKATFAAAGAFAFPEGSRDAALVVTLPPGAYTVVTSGVGNTTGNALVEVYDLDP